MLAQTQKAVKPHCPWSVVLPCARSLASRKRLHYKAYRISFQTLKEEKGKGFAHDRGQEEDGNVSRLPTPILRLRVVQHVGVVPTLGLASKQPRSDPGIALLMMLDSRLQDARVRKIY